MCLLATSEFSHEAVKKHQETIINSLKTERWEYPPMNFTFSLSGMCLCVKELSTCSTLCATVPTPMKLFPRCWPTWRQPTILFAKKWFGSSLYPLAFRFQVLKVAILAEKYATDYTWYVDVILKLIRIAGDYVSEEVWYRVIQVLDSLWFVKHPYTDRRKPWRCPRICRKDRIRSIAAPCLPWEHGEGRRIHPRRIRQPHCRGQPLQSTSSIWTSAFQIPSVQYWHTIPAPYNLYQVLQPVPWN